MSETIWKTIVQHSKNLKEKVELQKRTCPTCPQTAALTPQEIETLANLWEQYVETLPLPWRNYALAILGYPRTVKYSEVPQLIRTDPHFAYLMIRVYGQ